MNNYPEKPKDIKRILNVTLFLVILISSGWFSNVNIFQALSNSAEGFEILGDLFFPFDVKYLSRLTPPMLETIQMAIVGSVLGSLLAIPFAIFAARNFSKIPAIAVPVRVFLSIFRTIPAMVFAAMFSAVFGFGTFAGVLALVIFTMGLVAKLTYESIESIDEGPVESLKATGATSLSILRYAIIPQVLPQFLSYVLYAFEVNIRAAAVLGYVGAGGIGDYYSRTLSFLRYSKTGSIIVYTFVVVIIIDFMSSKIREKLV